MKLAQEIKNLIEESSLDKAFKEKHPYWSGAKVKSGYHTREEAMKLAKEGKEQGKDYSVSHMDGPKTGPKSKYVLLELDK